MAWEGPLEGVSPGVWEIPASYRGVGGDLEMRVPARLVADDVMLEELRQDGAPEQLANVATLPGIVGHAWAMPDIHLGYGFPIGGVAAFDPDAGGVVSPGGVGFDINCGVRLLRTGLEEAQVRGRLDEVMAALFEAVPAGMGRHGGAGVSGAQLLEVLSEGAVWAEEQGLVGREELGCLEAHGRIEEADAAAVSQRALERGRRSLGSLGSGNHFLEVQAVAEVQDRGAAAAYALEEGSVVLMVHTGSRGLGHQVCQDHVGGLQGVPARHGIRLVDRQLACAPLDSPEAERYLGAMGAAANFAFVNRSIVAARAREALHRVFGGDEGEVTTVYDVCHNIAKWEEHEVEGRRRRVLVHRKGATRAFGPGHPELPPEYQDVGQPVLVPGDMGRSSFVLAGRGTGAAAGPHRPFASCCHGAGRRLSRTRAKREHDGAELVRRLREEQGIVVRAVSPAVAAEEAPDAYKDAAQVVAAAEQAGLARRVARLRPLGVVKG